MKLTKHRRAILAVVLQADDHPTAAQVYERARKALPTVGYATVYRNLRALTEAGLLREIHIGDATQYDRRTDRHDHVVCRRCGKLADVTLPLPQEVLDQVAVETGYAIREHHTELSGLCAGCR